MKDTHSKCQARTRRQTRTNTHSPAQTNTHTHTHTLNRSSCLDLELAPETRAVSYVKNYTITIKFTTAIRPHCLSANEYDDGIGRSSC